MFFSKKSILTMFAGAVLLYTAGLNSVNAFADTGNNSPTQSASPDSIGQIDGSGNATNNNKPSASSTSNTSTPSNASVTGKSDAHVRVVNGYLVLETVPSLGFEDVSSNGAGNNNSNRVVDNQTVLNSDSFFKDQSKPQDLYVLDARSGNICGYNVNAQLGAFGTYNSAGILNQSNVKDNNGENIDQNTNPFTLTLSGSFDQTPNDSSSNVTNKAVLKSSNTNNSATVLTNNATSASGATKVNFGDNRGNGGGSTSLSVPSNIQSGQYAAPITWTLTSGVNSAKIN